MQGLQSEPHLEYIHTSFYTIQNKLVFTDLNVNVLQDYYIFDIELPRKPKMLRISTRSAQDRIATKLKLTTGTYRKSIL